MKKFLTAAGAAALLITATACGSQTTNADIQQKQTQAQTQLTQAKEQLKQAEQSASMSPADAVAFIQSSDPRMISDFCSSAIEGRAAGLTDNEIKTVFSAGFDKGIGDGIPGVKFPSGQAVASYILSHDCTS